jgi:hypothetical protein
MKYNQHVQSITSTVLTQAQAKIDKANALLAIYITVLASSERHELPKMDEKPSALMIKDRIKYNE